MQRNLSINAAEGFWSLERNDCLNTKESHDRNSPVREMCWHHNNRENDLFEELVDLMLCQRLLRPGVSIHPR